MGTSLPSGAVCSPTARQLARMGIGETTLGGKANTLVIANVGGFHRRGEFVEGRRREQIQMKFLDRPGRADEVAAPQADSARARS